MLHKAPQRGRRGLLGIAYRSAAVTLTAASVLVGGALGQDAPKTPPPVNAGNAPRPGTSAQSAQTSKTRAEVRTNHGRLRPFYDFSFHSVADHSNVNMSDYLVDQRFWGRRPTLVVITPLSPNVLQPDETYAEATTETLLRQIGADLGVREAHDQVSQAVEFLRNLRKRSKKTEETEQDRGARDDKPTSNDDKPSSKVEPAKAEARADTSNNGVVPADARGLQTVQLILLADTRPIWNGMSLFDRATVVDRSLKEFLSHVPIKRERVLEFLEADQFRFGAYLGKDSVNPIMDGLGLKRPDFHVLIIDRNGEVLGSWNKATFDAKQISTAYIRAGK